MIRKSEAQSMSEARYEARLAFNKYMDIRINKDINFALHDGHAYYYHEKADIVFKMDGYTGAILGIVEEWPEGITFIEGEGQV